MHRGAEQATGAPQTFFYNNKLQFSELTVAGEPDFQAPAHAGCERLIEAFQGIH